MRSAPADVHVGARLAGAADPGEVLISEAAAERAGQAGLELTDRGIRSLKGLPGTLRVFAVGTKQPAAVLGPRPSAKPRLTRPPVRRRPHA